MQVGVPQTRMTLKTVCALSKLRNYKSPTRNLTRRLNLFIDGLAIMRGGRGKRGKGPGEGGLEAEENRGVSALFTLNICRPMYSLTHSYAKSSHAEMYPYAGSSESQPPSAEERKALAFLWRPIKEKSHRM